MDILELQNTLLSIYQKNIKYFELNNPTVYNKIKNFEAQNIENWYIDLVDGRFELSNINGDTVYNCDPFYDAQYRVSNINKCPLYTLISLAPYIKGVTKYKDSINGYEFVNEYINMLSLNQDDCIKYAKKFIFIGTLLGVHINDIASYLKYDVYLVVEDNIEIFRLSLFMCDYEQISKNAKVFFAIGCDDFELEEKVKEFLDYKYEHNHFIPFELSDISKQHFISKLNLLFLNNHQITYPFSEYMVSLKRGLNHSKNMKNGVLKLKTKKEVLSNTPIIFIGAGPSLAKNIEWLYLWQDSFLVVCASASLKKLELLGIIPDIIITMDGQFEAINRQFQVSHKMYENSLIFFTLKIDLEISSMFDEDKIFYIQDSLEIFDECGINTGVTVGDTGLKVLLGLGAKEIYLLGFDASLNPKSGKSHIGEHSSSKNIDISKANDSFLGNYDKDIIWVKGNFEEKVPTLVLYKNMIDNINQTLYNEKDIKVYNLSNGAYFENTTPLNPTKFFGIMDFNKQYTVSKLRDNLAQISQKELSRIELSMLEKEKKILKRLKNANFDNITKDIQTLKSKYNYSISLEILIKYLKLCEPYCDLTKSHHIKRNQILLILEQLESSFRN